MSSSPPLAPARTAPLWRRCAALFYDSLLLTAVLMLAVALALLVKGGTLAAESLFFRLYLLLVSGLFFTGFWAGRGQTLGMQTWRLRVQRQDGRRLSWWRAWLRFVLALLSIAAAGLGLLWILVDRDRLPLYDRLADTTMVYLPKQRDKLVVDV